MFRDKVIAAVKGMRISLYYIYEAALHDLKLNIIKKEAFENRQISVPKSFFDICGQQAK